MRRWKHDWQGIDDVHGQTRLCVKFSLPWATAAGSHWLSAWAIARQSSSQMPNSVASHDSVYSLLRIGSGVIPVRVLDAHPVPEAGPHGRQLRGGYPHGWQSNLVGRLRTSGTRRTRRLLPQWRRRPAWVSRQLRGCSGLPNKWVAQHPIIRVHVAVLSSRTRDADRWSQDRTNLRVGDGLSFRETDKVRAMRLRIARLFLLEC
jgi:hypothetical protein